MEEQYLGKRTDANESTVILKDISYPDPEPKKCEAVLCNEAVFGTCQICMKPLCFDHFLLPPCKNHTSNEKKIAKKRQKSSGQSSSKCLENVVEGEKSKNEEHIKKGKINKQKLAKKSRDLGKAYISPSTGKLVPERKLQPRCNGEQCKKRGRECVTFDEEQRMRIFNAFYALEDLTRQREYIARHIRNSETRQKTTKKKQEKSRRTQTNQYFLTNKDNFQHLVCKLFFLHTLGISERTMRTALKKVNSNGVVEGEKRGGRKSKVLIERDRKVNAVIKEHIERFPKEKPQSSRSTSSKQYLHSELSIAKMYAMFLNEIPSDSPKPGISLYRKIFKSMNLAFHAPKKKD